MNRHFDINRIWLPVAALALSMLYYICPWRTLPGSSDMWGIPFLFLFLLVLPGSILYRIIHAGCGGRIERAVLSVLYGLVYFLFLSFIWALTGSNISWLRMLYPAALVPLLVAYWAIKSKCPDYSYGRMGPGTIVVLTLCAAIFILVWKSGVDTGYTKDTLDHVAYVNEISSTGKAFPSTEFYIDAGEDGKDTRKGLLHVFYGFTAEYMDLDALPVLGAWNAFFAVLLILSVYTASVMLFENQWAASASAMFFILDLLNGTGGMTVRESFYASRFGFAFLLFVMVFTLSFISGRSKRMPAACAFFAFAAAAVHIFYSILAGFIIAIIAIWKTCFQSGGWKEHMARTFTPAAAVVAGAAPYVIYRYFTAFGLPNELHSDIQGVFYLTRGIFIFGPFKLLSSYGVTGFIAFFAAIFLWRERKQSLGLGYLAASCFTMPVVMLNPALFEPLQRGLTYLVLRIPQLFPHYMLAGYFVSVFPELRNSRKKRRAAGLVLFAAFIIAAAVGITQAVTSSIFAPSRLKYQQEHSYLLWSDELAFLSRNLTRGSVIVSDPLTCYSITALTPHFSACTLDQHASPLDHSLLKRLQMSRAVLSPFTGIKRTIDCMDSLRADYVILNNRMREHPQQLFYWSMEPDLFSGMFNKFASRPDLFDVLLNRDEFVLLKRKGFRPLADDFAANPYVLDSIPGGFTRFGLYAGEAELEAVYIHDRQTKRGGKLTISLIWSGRGAYRMGSHVVALRFNHLNAALPFNGKPFPKVIRKAKERLTGRRYRFRSDHKILNGFLSPDTWPKGALVLDERIVSVPRNVEEGTYSISVKLIETAFSPNSRLRDLLFDNDGPQVGTIDIY